MVVTIYLCRCYSYYLPITSLLRDFSNRNISRNEETNNLDVCFVIELEFNQIKMTWDLFLKIKWSKHHYSNHLGLGGHESSALCPKCTPPREEGAHPILRRWYRDPECTALITSVQRLSLHAPPWCFDPYIISSFQARNVSAVKATKAALTLVSLDIATELPALNHDLILHDQSLALERPVFSHPMVSTDKK